MFKQIFEIFKSDSLYKQALVECHEMLDIDLTMFKASIQSLRKSDTAELDIDIYAPCALGATVNPDTIARLKCEIIAGSANNQLSDEDRDGQLCADKGILYAPDFLINAGGLINVYSKIKGYDKEHAINQTRAIYDTTLEIFKKAELDEITTHAAALAIAEQRITDRKNQ